MTLAYAHKDRHGFGLSVVWNTRIQYDRDHTRCTCGHPNISHGHGTDAGPTWPDGSRIGRGPCGTGRCTCRTFTDANAPAASDTHDTREVA